MRHLVLAVGCVALALSGCASKSTSKKVAAGVKIGKPYSIGGEWYYPKYEPDYAEEGMASWYGPGFDGKSTASGEIFDQEDRTAAHRTLPLPSLVKVTNLQNNRSAVVRVNDRGPFKDGRIIDLSKGSARELGVLDRGLARVRVEYLDDETRQHWASLGMSTKQIQTAEASVARARDKADKNTPAYLNYPSQTVSSASAAPIGAVDVRPLAAGGVAARELAPLVPQTRDFAFSGSSGVTARALPPVPPPSEGNWQSTGSNASSVYTLSASRPPASAPQWADTGSMPRTASGSYYLQTGAFALEVNAESQRAKLAPLGAAKIQHTRQGDVDLYRVKLGPFASAEDAHRARERIQRDYGIAESKVVAE